MYLPQGRDKAAEDRKETLRVSFAKSLRETFARPSTSSLTLDYAGFSKDYQEV
jgi:hypothetical protein